MARKFLLLVLLIPIFVLTSCGGDTFARIRKNRQVSIGTVPFEAPLLHQQGQEFVGPDVELANRIVDRIREVVEEAGSSGQIEARWIGRSYGSLVGSLENEQVELVLGVFGITEDRKEEVAFSEPYYTSELVLIINPVHQDIRPNRLGGRSIGVREGTAVEQFVQQKFKSSKTMPFETLDEAVLALKRREVDAVIDDRYMSAYSLDTVPGVAHLEIIPEPLGTVECGVAVRQGDERLLGIVNEVVAQVNGENLYTQWLQEKAAEQYARVEKRLQERMEAGQPRSLVIRISKDQNYDFDIYRMANLRFTLTNQDSGESYTSSRIDFRNRVGVSSTEVPPGTYRITLRRMNNWTPGAVTVVPSDPNEVTVNIRLRRGGNVVMTRS